MNYQALQIGLKIYITNLQTSKSALKCEEFFLYSFSPDVMVIFSLILKDLLSDPSEQNSPRGVVLALFFDRIFRCCGSSLIFRCLPA